MTKNSNHTSNHQISDDIGIQKPIEKNSPQGSIKSFSKLIIGSIVIGIDELNYRLKYWEEKSQPHQIEKEAVHISIRQDIPTTDNTNIPYEIIEGELQQDRMRFALIGLMSETQGRLVSTSQKVKRIGVRINRFTYPIIKPLNRNWLIPPLQRRYEGLIERGENELNRLNLVGRSEYAQSRRMAQVAYEESFEEAVDSLATNPDVQNLIQSQGMGMAEEIIDEVRERAVSADNYLDGLFRKIFRRKPRSSIPPPSFKNN